MYPLDGKFMFLAEWYNDLAEVVKPFLLTYFSGDKTLEIYDLQCRRIFLRRTKLEHIDLDNLYKGAIVNIYSRQIRIVNYANESTARKFHVGLQKIFCIIKTDSMCKMGEIIAKFEKMGCKLIRMRMGQMTDEMATIFLKLSSETESPALEHVVAFSTGPILGFEAICEDGIRRCLDVIGPSDPSLAKMEAPNSLRASYGTDIVKNAIHINPDSQLMKQECDLWFHRDKRHSGIGPTCQFENSTCCIIKPHAVQEAKVGEILSAIFNSGFKISAVEMMTLNRLAAEEFYEVYKGVVPEYSSMVSQLVAGPCIALEVVNVNDPPSSPMTFRQLTGPVDPINARKIAPSSLRAKYGSSTVLNAIHCTDLPDDAKLEVEYFFKILLK